MQVAAFSVFENVPEAHGVHVLPFTKVPGLHVAQYPADNPLHALWAPARHSMLLQEMHDDCAVWFWKNPSAHTLQLG